MKLLPLITLLFTSSLHAQDFTFDKSKGKAIPNYVAEIKLFKGRVFKVINGEMKEVQVGTRFFKNDKIITQEKSFVKLMIVDDTVMNLGPHSELGFAEFKFADKTDRHIVYDLVKGQVRGIIKHKADEGDVIVKTKFAAMAIRGTEVLVNHHEIKGTAISEFALLSGAASITDSKKQKIDILKGNKVIFADDPKTKESDSEQSKLAANEFSVLEAVDKKEETDFKPFMPFLKEEDLKVASPLYKIIYKETANLTTTTNHQEINDGETKDPSEAKGSFRNLQDLNEQLKNNRN
jgi:hypothetical protein